MADLINSLVIPSDLSHTLEHKSSNESFHSTRSQGSHSSPSQAPVESHESLPLFNISDYLNEPASAALLASTGSKRKSSHSNTPHKASFTSPDSLEPIPLGNKTSHHVPALNHLCQGKGLPAPLFDIDQDGEGDDARFGGAIRVGSTKLGCQKTWRSKKEAREGLSEEAMPTVMNMTAIPHEQAHQYQQRVSVLVELCQAKGLPTPVFDVSQYGQGNDARFGGSITVGDYKVNGDGLWKNKKEARSGLAEEALRAVEAMPSRGRSSPEQVTKNHIGLLHQYYQAEGTGLSPTYEYYSIGPQSFSVTCTLPGLSSQTFGSSTNPFPSKKSAQAAVAQEAVEHLISTGKLKADGSTLKKSKNSSKSSPVSPNTSNPSGASGEVLRVLAGDKDGKGMGIEIIDPHASFAQLVASLAPLLGLPQTQYHLSPASAQAPNLLSGHASFVGGGAGVAKGLSETLGEVRHVFGKKNAKEELAREVWEKLKDIADARGFKVKER
ncbi:uncharacterized protein KY384_001509 [Bacidia gigantensis]|uniref:uncharacterized protein n=1 Tax=Bacidia gigantensis TaxID=2732470 RepID=UPI001D0478FF|nr:uncharacterized protein KY384_001509 [Bacidia gigantensis]KAG8533768.1 hypothetical protein KY384_001509 [Bacidia gigantensis]